MKEKINEKGKVDLLPYQEKLRKIEEQGRQLNSACLDAAIELSLAEQGIDPEKVAKRDFDMLHRANTKIDEIKAKAQEKIVKIQQEAGLEIQAVHEELANLNQQIRQQQGLPDEHTVSENSTVDSPGTPKPD